MRVRYSPKALSELEHILDYIAERSPQGAQNVQRRLQRISDLLAVYPTAGEPTNIPGLRRIVAVPYPYLVFHGVIDNEVIITGLRHGARR